jgi:hypothetical protein
MSPELVEEEKKRVPIMRNTDRENCAVTTLGAISCQSTSDFVKGWMKEHEMADVADICTPFQGDDMWAYIEEGEVPNGLPNDFEGLRSDLNGDAQLRGIREAMLKEAKNRNGEGGLEFQVIQDGVNDRGQMYPVDELAGRMAKYPDGTQFQVFISGDMKHWIYAEKFDGKVIFEDYQLTSKEKKEPTARLADGPPDNPMSGVGGSFQEGMFIAIAPIKKGEAAPEHKADANWAEPGSEADRALAEVTSQLSRAKSPTALAEVLEKNKATIKAEWCDVDVVAAAIRAADEAVKALKGVIDTREEQAGHINKHNEALSRIRARNTQIDRLLLQKALLPLQNPVFGGVKESADAAQLLRLKQYWSLQTLPKDIDGLLAELTDAKHADKIPEKDGQIFKSLQDRVLKIQALMREPVWTKDEKDLDATFSAMDTGLAKLSTERQPLAESVKMISIDVLKSQVKKVIVDTLDEEFKRLKKEYDRVQGKRERRKAEESAKAFDWDGVFANVMNEYNTRFKSFVKKDCHDGIEGKLKALNLARTSKAMEELKDSIGTDKLASVIRGTQAMRNFVSAIQALDAGLKV